MDDTEDMGVLVPLGNKLLDCMLSCGLVLLPVSLLR